VFLSARVISLYRVLKPLVAVITPDLSEVDEFQDVVFYGIQSYDEEGVSKCRHFNI